MIGLGTLPRFEGIETVHKRCFRTELAELGTLPRFEGIETDCANSQIVISFCGLGTLPRFEGIETLYTHELRFQAFRWEHCPVSRGLRRFSNPMLKFLSISWEHCPVSRGLRRILVKVKTAFTLWLGTLPRFEGIET